MRTPRTKRPRAPARLCPVKRNLLTRTPVIALAAALAAGPVVALRRRSVVLD